MFQSLAAGWADLVLPGTSYLERDGTYINLEGRLQRLRRAVIPQGPDELEWLSQLATRFDVDLSPYAPRVFEELAASAFGGLRFAEIAEVAPLRVHTEPEPPSPLEGVPPPAPPPDGDSLQVLRYRPLFSGVAVERVPELQFQRPEPEIELAYDDAQRRDVSTGDEVIVRSNGTAIALRAMVNRRLLSGIVRVADEHATGLGATVEVTKTPSNQIASGGGDLA
jgi:predicted molibdopterin-dependent oxidoreductase YjgC